MPLTLKNFYKQWGWGWQPWANTVVYYPFTSLSTTTDQSWNWHDLTNYWNVTFWTFNWVDCASFGTNSPYWLYITSWNIITSTKYTWSCWLNQTIENGVGNPRMFGGKNDWFIILNDMTDDKYAPSYQQYNWIPYTSWWHHLVFVGDLSDWTFTWYKDWVLVWNFSWWTTWWRTWIMIWWNGSYPNNTNDRYIWYMSEMIFDQPKQWTAQEISDYFNQTKSLYGIS